MFEDSRGRLWVGTAGGGLNRIERDAAGGVRFTPVTENDGLVDNDVMGLLEDDGGSLWISTRRGLSRFDPETSHFANFGVSDGLPAAEFEPGAVARSRDRLYFGSVGGLVAIPIETTFAPPASSPVVIASITTTAGHVRGNLPAWKTTEVEVPYGDWLSFELAVLDYRTEGGHRYAYRLDEDWIDLGSRRDITFTDLQPGTHEFAAMGRNSQGVWNETVSTLQIRVVPPFWMTGWFRGLSVLLVISLFIVGHRLRLSAVERRNRELLRLHEQRERAREELREAYVRLRRLTRRLEAVKEDERRHLARELHDEMGPALTAVIINLQLLSEHPEPERVIRKIPDTIRLVDRLIQRVRDLSLDLRPPLLDELGLVPALKGYMESQAQRGRLRIDVQAEDTIQGLPPEVEIATFRVAQEAVTNVIRHAGADRATVTVRAGLGQVEVRVRDNGRGFDVRDTLNGGVTGKALGLLGIQERVTMLGGELEIDSGAGRGTEVRARIPIEVHE